MSIRSQIKIEEYQERGRSYHRVFVDGHDISHAVHRVTFELDAHDRKPVTRLFMLAKVELELNAAVEYVAEDEEE